MEKNRESLWDQSVQETEKKFGDKTYEWVRGTELFTIEAGNYQESRYTELNKV